jgi:hypothetical protein
MNPAVTRTLPGAATLTHWGVDARQFRALLRAFVLMDLRGQHYTRATGTQPRHAISPLFWVVGQCLTLSAVTSLVLFARVDVWFFAFVHFCFGLSVLAAAVLVEFHEAVVSPHDLAILGHRPIRPRTYAAARLCNLLLYVGLIGTALNIIPLIVGVGLRDGGGWFALAYGAASFAASMLVVLVVVWLTAGLGQSAVLEQVKAILAWSQIVLILVAGYGAQLMFRDSSAAVLVWAMYPPPWVDYLPPSWPARFVEWACATGGLSALAACAAVVGLGLLAGWLTLLRVVGLVRRMQPAVQRFRERPMPAGQLGRVGGRLTRWLCPTPGQQVGYALTGTLLSCDGDLRVRTGLAGSAAVAVVLLGLGTGQFANPLQSRDLAQITLPVTAIYLLALAVPAMVYNLCFCRDYEAAWLILSAPCDAADFGLGVCKAVMVRYVVPLAAAYGLIAAVWWADPLAAILHASLAVGLAWVMALAALWLVVPDLPLTLPTARGASIGPVALPLAIFSLALFTIAGFHIILAATWGFWAVLGLATAVSAWQLRQPATTRLRRLRREAA